MGYDDTIADCIATMLGAVTQYADYSLDDKKHTIHSLTYLYLIMYESDTYTLAEAKIEAQLEWLKAYAAGNHKVRDIHISDLYW